MSDEDFGKVLESMAFVTQTPRQMVEGIADRIGKMAWYQYPQDNETRIRWEVDKLAERHGNLGMTRRKLRQLVLKEVKKRYNRARWAKYRKDDVHQDA